MTDRLTPASRPDDERRADHDARHERGEFDPKQGELPGLPFPMAPGALRVMEGAYVG